VWNQLNYAVHAAALSIDACQILRNWKFTRDRSLPQLSEGITTCGETQQIPMKRLCYVNMDEICDVTFEALSRFWPSMAAFAASRLATYSLMIVKLDLNDFHCFVGQTGPLCTKFVQRGHAWDALKCCLNRLLGK
jgi:hypothetical protein